MFPTPTTVSESLRQLSGVTVKSEFGSRAFFVGGTRFAAVTADAILLHLPPDELTEALVRGLARPFVSVGAMGRHGWVEIRLAAASEEDIQRYIAVAHGAALHGHRRTAMRKPSRARHTRKASGGSRK